MKYCKGNPREAPVTVKFPIPRAAAEKLRTLAVSKDRRLLDLGVLAVQISEGESIVLGINIGKQVTRKTEVNNEKLRGNSRRGRVSKKFSTCRNVATIHHRPSVDKLHAAHMESSEVKTGVKRSTTEKSRATVRSRLNHGVVTCANNKPSDGEMFPLSSHTTSYVKELSLCEQRNLISHKFKPNRVQQSGVTEGAATFTRSPGLTAADDSNEREKINSNERRSSPISPMAEVLAGTTHNVAMGSQTLSSPRSQRVRTTSSGSDSSSISSEENFDTHQLVYSCFVDRSKYSAADMLKQLANSHICKGGASGTGKVKGTTVLGKVSTVTTVPSSTKPSNPSASPTDTFNYESSSAIKGSYRAHLKRIRNTSVAVLTSSATAVASISVDPKFSSEHHAIPASLGCCSTSSFTKTSAIATSDTSTSQIVWQSKGLSISTNTTPAKVSLSNSCNGKVREVLWSSANVLSNHASKNPHKTSQERVEVSSSLATAPNSLRATDSCISEIQTASLCCNGDDSSVTMHSTIKSQSVASAGNRQSVSGKGTLFVATVADQSSKTNMTSSSASSTVNDSKLTADGYKLFNPCTSSNSTSVTETRNSVQVCGTGASLPQSSVDSKSSLIAADAVAGTNTQTTWTSQQVSPTYVVGAAQAQFGIYPAVYQTNLSTNKPDQQTSLTTYPVNYVYPVSFVYPYLAVAQRNNVVKADNGGVGKQQEKLEPQLTTVPDKPPDTGESKTKESASQAVVTSTQTTSIVVPTQTQFIDLASSMRYWQQLSLLCRSRWQAVATGNVSSATQSHNASDAKMVGTSGTETKVIVVNQDTNVNSLELKSGHHLPTKWSASEANLSEYSSVGDKNNDSESAETFSKLHPNVKTDVGAINGRGAEDTATDRPSVIVSNSYQYNNAGFVKPTESSVCNVGKIDAPNHGDVHMSSPGSVPSPAVKLGDMIDQLERKTPVEVKQTLSCPPQLSFIHDSAIACVNVGSNNNLSVSNYGANKKTGNVEHVS